MKTFFYSEKQEKKGYPVKEVLTKKGWVKFTQIMNEEIYSLKSFPDAKVVFMSLNDEITPIIKETNKILNNETEIKRGWVSPPRMNPENRVGTRTATFTSDINPLMPDESFFNFLSFILGMLNEDGDDGNL